MNWTIPGTTLTAQREDAGRMRGQFQSLFLAGGIALGQITSITGLDPYMIQNWVKRGFLTKPAQKRYSLNQLCRIITINMLKGVLPMDRICGLLSYVNGKLDDESDDIIDDADLYFLFVRLAARARDLDTHEQWEQAIHDTLAEYREPVPGARQRVEQVMQVMLTAWVAARMAQEAERMMGALELPENPNLADLASVRNAFRMATDVYGCVDILVNNAGISESTPFMSYTEETFDKVMDLNVKGVFNATRAAAECMVARGKGVILSTSSMVSISGQPSGFAYPASKFAVNGLTVSLARELGPKGIRVNAVAPGITETDMMKAVPKEVIEPMIAQIPLRRLGQPEDIANAFVFLASDEASYITGVVLSVDGMARS